jgi:pimeloyl-ACP methyl ester carboxylesterase
MILIHGSGSCKESWQEQTRYFSEAEAIDLPGHPRGRLRRSIEGYVQWLNTYVAEKDLTDLILVGHSMGGAIALAFGLAFPARVKGLICVGSGARLRVHPMHLESLQKAMAESAQQQAAAIKAFYPLGRIAPALARIILQRIQENGLPAVINDLRACDQFDVMDQLGRLDIPLLAICGSDDELTPCKYADYLARRMPRARSVAIAGGTHFVHAEKPAAVNRVIADFIKNL